MAGAAGQSPGAEVFYTGVAKKQLRQALLQLEYYGEVQIGTPPRLPSPLSVCAQALVMTAATDPQRWAIEELYDSDWVQDDSLDNCSGEHFNPAVTDDSQGSEAMGTFYPAPIVGMNGLGGLVAPVRAIALALICTTNSLSSSSGEHFHPAGNGIQDLMTKSCGHWDLSIGNGIQDLLTGNGFQDLIAGKGIQDLVTKSYGPRDLFTCNGIQDLLTGSGFQDLTGVASYEEYGIEMPTDDSAAVAPDDGNSDAQQEDVLTVQEPSVFVFGQSFYAGCYIGFGALLAVIMSRAFPGVTDATATFAGDPGF